MTSQASVAVAADITAEDLGKVSHTKVFFGHQSVGMNILDGVGGVYAAHGMAAPMIGEAVPIRAGTGSSTTHSSARTGIPRSRSRTSPPSCVRAAVSMRTWR